jgi:hypothetical protein
MPNLLTLLLAALLLSTLVLTKPEHESLSTEQMAANELKSAQEQDAVNLEWASTWEKTKAATFSDPAETHTLPQVLKIAYKH